MASVCGLGLPASAEQGRWSRGAIDALEVVPGLLEETDRGSANSSDRGGDDVSVQVRGAGGQMYSLSATGARSDVRAEPAGAGVDVLSGTAADTDTVVQELRDGARVLEVIGSDSAPTSFEYAIDVPEGTTMSSQQDGSIIIGTQETNGDEVSMQVDAVVGAPWAVDADGRPVPASYDIGPGGSLTMTVDHSGQFSYPIVADPALTAGGFRASWNVLTPHQVTILLNRARTSDAEDGGSLVCIGVAFIPVVGPVIGAICGVHNVAIRAAARYGSCQRWDVNAVSRSFRVSLYRGGFCR